MEKFSLISRFIALGIYGFLFSQIFFLLGDKVWNFDVISQLFTRWYEVLGYAAGVGLEIVIYQLAFIMNSFVGLIFRISLPAINPVTINLINFLRGYWGYPTELPPAVIIDFSNIQDDILGTVLAPILYMLQPLYYSFYPLLFVITIFSIVAYMFLGNIRTGQIAFAALMGVVVVASFHFPPLATRSIPLGFEIPSIDISQFLVSTTFQIGIISYFFIEAIYMTDFLSKILDPQIKRKKWLETQISIIKREAKKERKIVNEGEIMKGSQFSRRMSSEAFSFIRDNLEKRIFKRNQDEDRTVIKNVRRLESYLRELKRKTPEVIDNLKAESAKATGRELTTPIVIGIFLRSIIIISLGFLVLQPLIVMNFINSPLPVLQSLEATTPEMSLFILLPIAMTFPVSALGIRRIIQSKNNGKGKAKVLEKEKTEKKEQVILKKFETEDGNIEKHKNTKKNNKKK
ncbi:MAG: hypothetical protein ACTSUV_06975 [Candidatus Ranarchaeia archaeon]